VIEFAGRNKKGRRLWKCVCSCNGVNEKIVCTNDLRSGKIRSCGCLQRESRREAGLSNKKYSKYDLSGEYGMGYTSDGHEFYFDLEDYEIIKDYCWSTSIKGYIENVSKERGTGKSVRTSMHRLIMDCPDDKVVDHIGGRGTENDNRKSNLRIATLSENSHNTKVRERNTTGCNGVNFCRQNGKYKAGIMINRKQIHLGYFTNLHDAVFARKKAEEDLCGVFSPDKSKKIYLEGGDVI
jgi:hypothetical protein